MTQSEYMNSLPSPIPELYEKAQANAHRGATVRESILQRLRAAVTAQLVREQG